MIKITWNKSTRTYTVSGNGRIVRGIEAKTQAVAVQMDLRYGSPASFGTEE